MSVFLGKKILYGAYRKLIGSLNESWTIDIGMLPKAFVHLG